VSSDEACEGCELEFDQRDEELDRQDEERHQHDEPSYKEHEYLDEVLEERDVAQKGACGLQDRPAGIDPNLGEPARLEELVGRETRTGGLQAEARERVEHDLGKAVEVADQEGEEADVEGFFDKVDEHILIGAPRPEQTCDRHVEDHEGRGQKRDLAAEQAEA
jgi:hypothetical protein